MHEYMIDLRLVREVWQNIESHDDVRLREKKREIHIKCKDLLDKSSHEATQLSSTAADQAAALPQPQLAERSLQVVLDVLVFVSGACNFYDTVKAYHPLTQEEQEIGNKLALLTKQVQAIVPAGGS